MQRMGCSVFWAATLFTTVAHPVGSQTAEKSNLWGGQPYPIRKDIAPPVGLTPAAAYTGIAPGALNTPVEPRKEPRPPALGPWCRCGWSLPCTGPRSRTPPGRSTLSNRRSPLLLPLPLRVPQRWPSHPA
jgi:hypothetical protein